MIFNSFAGAAGVVLVAALSPGPNNVVVLRAAAAGDGSRAWSAIGGVVCGGIAMLAGTIAAGSAVLTTPHFRLGVAIAGATYLAWLGLTMMRGSASPGKDSPLPAGFYGVFVFQFLNPKSWVMVLSLVAAFPPMGRAMTFAWLAPIFVVIPTACLLLWAVAGRRLAGILRRPESQRRLDQAMGAALITAAALLLL